MKLIVGLGNPGRAYIDSRHNIGFAVVKKLSREEKAALKSDKGTFSLSAKCKFGQEAVILALPLTYMNLSGAAVVALLKKHRIDTGDLLVICDDLDLGFGRLKVSPSGSSGGHRGLKSIIESLGGRDFCRLRIGIGRPLKSKDPAEYVLAPFPRAEKKVLSSIIEEASLCCRLWTREGAVKSMNIFNRRFLGIEPRSGE